MLMITGSGTFCRVDVPTNDKLLQLLALTPVRPTYETRMGARFVGVAISMGSEFLEPVSPKFRAIMLVVLSDRLRLNRRSQ